MLQWTGNKKMYWSKVMLFENNNQITDDSLESLIVKYSNNTRFTRRRNYTERE